MTPRSPDHRLAVEIWSDIVCPWCAVGKRRFEAALESFEHADAVDVTWRSFELDPAAPAELGMPLVDHLAAKYRVPRHDALGMQERMREVGEGVGLDMRFDRARSGSTFDAHRVLHLAARHRVQGALKERFLLAYLTEGELMSDHGTLVRLAGEAGLDEAAVRSVLDSDEHAEDVRRDEAEARALGISGVPFFVLDRRMGVSGAQPPDVLLDALAQAWAAARPLTIVGAPEAAACTDEACGC